MTTLAIQIGLAHGEGDDVRWTSLDDSGGRLDQGSDTLADLSAKVDEWEENDGARPRIVVLLPDQELLYVRTRIPGTNRNRIRQAAPFSIEQYLTEDVEHMHVAVGPFSRGELIPVAAVRDDLFNEILEALTEAGLEPEGITSLGLLANAQEDEVVVLLEGDIGLVRTHHQMAAVDAAAIPELVGTVVSTFDEDAELAYRVVIDSPPSTAVSDWIGSLPEEDTELVQRSPVDFLVGEIDLDEAFNLLQGAYEKSDIYTTTRSKWGEVATVAMVCLCVGCAVLGVEGYWAKYQAQLLRDSGNELYQALFDEPNPFGSPALRMQERLGLAESPGEGFGQLMQALAGAATTTELTNIWYRDTDRQLSASLQLASYDRLDDFKATVEGLGVLVNIRTAEQRDSVVVANLELTLP